MKLTDRSVSRSGCSPKLVQPSGDTALAQVGVREQKKIPQQRLESRIVDSGQ